MALIIALLLLLIITIAIAQTPIEVYSTPSASQGGVAYFSSPTAMASTAAGIAGQVLQSNGSAAPTWVNVSSGSLTPYTAATLPTCSNTSNKYVEALVTDSTAATYNGPPTGGGSTVVRVICNATEWVMQ
jgi:hypothetical protein